jgi:hypothetical protein
MRTHIGWPLALLALGLGEIQVRAQDIPVSPYDVYSGKRTRYHGSYVRISSVVSRMPGPILGGPRAVQPTNISATTQPIIIMPPPSTDLSGVDLDVVRPPWRQGNLPARVIERDSESGLEKALPPAEPLPLGGIDLSKPKPSDVRPPLPAPIPAPSPPAPEDRRDPDDPWRLMDLGRAAFAGQEFGTAARRFGQVTEVAPHLPLGYFLRAQAEFALGKHRLAVRSIEAGMRLKPEWPAVKTFHPRLKLYKGDEAEFDAHLKRLGDALQEQPLDGDLLFLYAYQVWFDGRNAEAAAYFERARAGAADSTMIDRFRKDGGWKVAIK